MRKRISIVKWDVPIRAYCMDLLMGMMYCGEVGWGFEGVEGSIVLPCRESLLELVVRKSDKVVREAAR